MKSKIVYNPELSIKENAENNHVTVDAVRAYIKNNGIDRKLDEQIKKYRVIHDLMKESTKPSFAEMSRLLGYSVNTIKRYAKMDEEPSIFGNTKISTFDCSKQSSIVKTVSYNQSEILANILRLYVKNKDYDCDLTYSVGNFYKHIPEPRHKFDKYPQMDGVKPLEEAYSLPECSFSSIVVDLPFIVKPEQIVTSRIALRFNYYRSESELYTTNDDMLALSYRLLKKQGILVWKTMDVRFSNRQLWISNYVQNKAQEFGFELLDVFILIAKQRLLRNTEQHCARKYHSYFLVFKKR